MSASNENGLRVICPICNCAVIEVIQVTVAQAGLETDINRHRVESREQRHYPASGYGLAAFAGCKRCGGLFSIDLLSPSPGVLIFRVLPTVNERSFTTAEIDEATLARLEELPA